MSSENVSATEASGPCLNELATLAARGDQRAADRLLERLQPTIARYCRAKIGRSSGTYATADDAAQEACLGIYAALPGYQETFPFLALAYRIAANKVADHYRRQRADRSTPSQEVPETVSNRAGPEEAVLRHELTEHVGLLLDVLPETQRELLVLRLGVGLSAAETAQTLDSTPGAVRTAQHRALATLRTAISPSTVLPRGVGEERVTSHH